jgi:fibro-slime domain-containing protein
MFRYRSEDNYAYLPFNPNTKTFNSSDFIVYRQAATPYTADTQPGHTYYYHGHFMPFNDIDMTQQVGRLMNQYGNDYQNGNIIGELPIGDGRTYEEVYGIQGTPNFYTGMKMEANFTQPRDGKLENGDDMVFKFTGDDDMWVYIDDVLVLDIGGIHEPLSGTINFATGVVTNPSGSSLAGTTTLYQIFRNVLTASGTPQSVKDKISAITWKDVNGDGTPDTFADYTNHSFGAFSPFTDTSGTFSSPRRRITAAKCPSPFSKWGQSRNEPFSPAANQGASTSSG